MPERAFVFRFQGKEFQHRRLYLVFVFGKAVRVLMCLWACLLATFCGVFFPLAFSLQLGISPDSIVCGVFYFRFTSNALPMEQQKRSSRNF
jgi:hypothetical protein